jgi:hypothetical protein
MRKEVQPEAKKPKRGASNNKKGRFIRKLPKGVSKGKRKGMTKEGAA